MNESKMPPITPGEILLEEFLKPLGISQYRLAQEMRVYPGKIHDIIRGKRAITAETALRLARFLGTSAELWMNLQTHYELEVAQDVVGERISQEITPYNLSNGKADILEQA